MTYGKNRIQTEEYFWEFKKYDRYSIYFYEGGAQLSDYAAQVCRETIDEFAAKFPNTEINSTEFNVLVYNKLEDFRKTNIGLNQQNAQIGGVVKISGNNIFVYFNGNHNDFKENIRASIAQILVHKMLFGSSWIEVVKNNALIHIPDWYAQGLVGYFAHDYQYYQFKIQDAIQFDRFKKFNRLSDREKQVFGYAFWYYLSVVYGENLFENILYISRVNRSVEAGFLTVLGLSFKQIKKEMVLFYQQEYRSDEKQNLKNDAKNMVVKTKKGRTYHNISLSNNGRFLAYSENNKGKTKVFMYDLNEKKRTLVFKQGHKLERIENDFYPLLKWHPSSKMLSVITENQGQVYINYYFTDKQKPQQKPLFEVEKVTSFNFSKDGKKIVFSAVKNGVSDIYIYKIISNTQQNITQDFADDIDPMFFDDQTIIYASNRNADTLNMGYDITELQDQFDLFQIQLTEKNKAKSIRNISKTPLTSEIKPKFYDADRFAYLSKNTNSIEKKLAHQDSAISHIDTTIHYRYFLNSKTLEYDQHLTDFDYTKNNSKGANIFYENGREQITLFTKTDSLAPRQKSNQPIEKTLLNARSKQIQAKKLNITYDTLIIKNLFEINTDNYQIGQYQNTSPSSLKDPSKITNPSTQKTSENQESIIQNLIVKPRKYNINFTGNEITSSFDFNFADQLYQPFNGGPYIQPSMGLVLKMSAIDLFEDYKLEGGIRYALGNDVTEFFLHIEDVSKRLDKRYSFERQVTQINGNFTSQKNITTVLKAKFSYPFSEVSSVRLTPLLRQDRTILLSTDPLTAEAKDQFDHWAGLKLEYVFDNNLYRGLNLYEGFKAKLFAEHYRIIDDLNTDFYVVGTDIRHGLKIHRNLIWFNRFSASSSFGTRKLVHYLGAVEQWAKLSEGPTFNFDTPIAQDQGYYFQTIVPPLRGFLQNARNGNSFALLNSELRFPIVDYLVSNPVKSEFFAHLQLTGFFDLGTAWNGPSPYSEENAFNTQTITDGNISITLKNQIDPLAAGTGFGLRTKLLGYFVKLDRAWGIENGDFKSPVWYFSIETDF